MDHQPHGRREHRGENLASSCARTRVSPVEPGCGRNVNAQTLPKPQLLTVNGQAPWLPVRARPPAPPRTQSRKQDGCKAPANLPFSTHKPSLPPNWCILSLGLWKHPAHRLWLRDVVNHSSTTAPPDQCPCIVPVPAPTGALAQAGPTAVRSRAPPEASDC